MKDINVSNKIVEVLKKKGFTYFCSGDFSKPFEGKTVNMSEIMDHPYKVIKRMKEWFPDDIKRS